MSTVEALLDQALQLSPEDRADLAHRLLRSVGAKEALSDEDWIAAWGPELERRVRSYESGETRATDWRESLERVRSSLAEHSGQ